MEKSLTCRRGEGDAYIRSSIVCVYTNDGRTDGVYTQGIEEEGAVCWFSE